MQLFNQHKGLSLNDILKLVNMNFPGASDEKKRKDFETFMKRKGFVNSNKYSSWIEMIKNYESYFQKVTFSIQYSKFYIPDYIKELEGLDDSEVGKVLIYETNDYKLVNALQNSIDVEFQIYCSKRSTSNGSWRKISYYKFQNPNAPKLIEIIEEFAVDRGSETVHQFKISAVLTTGEKPNKIYDIGENEVIKVKNIN